MLIFFSEGDSLISTGSYLTISKVNYIFVISEKLLLTLSFAKLIVPGASADYAFNAASAAFLFSSASFMRLFSFLRI